MNDILEKLELYTQKINEQLNILVPENDVLQKNLYEGIRYSLLSEGKRIRPILAIAASELFDGKIEEVMPFACSIEMIHAYSLIHDDLPAMDDDDFRRGKPTNHKVYGEAMAILAGDALLSKGFQVMIDTLRDSQNIENKIKAMKLIADAVGIEGMIGGQVIDIESEGKNIDIETLKIMHSLKTGALINASVLVGATISGANATEINKLRTFAQNLGLAFQIKDDILSEAGNSIKMGKNTGNDREKNKSTYVTNLGLEKAEELLIKTTARAIEALKGFSDKASFLLSLSEYLCKREK